MMSNNMTTSTPRPYKEQVLTWLNEAGPGTYSIGTISEVLDFMDRRQVTTALHGLAEYGLEGRLSNVGKGLWRFQPSADEPAAFRYSVFADGVGRTEVPLGYTTDITVVTKTTTAQGTDYIARTSSGTLLRLIPIFSVDSMKYDPNMQDGSKPREA